MMPRGRLFAPFPPLAGAFRAAALCLALLAPAGTVGMARASDVTVFAAASLKTALDSVAADWAAAGGGTMTVSYAGSSLLANQIAQGAPADILIAASTDWMDFLADRGLIERGTRIDLLGNSLVLIATGPATSVATSPAAPAVIDADLDIAAALGPQGRLAVALVDAVPAGQYARAALTQLGQWDKLAPRLAQTDNVRSALALVAMGEAPLGVVYATDAMAEPGVHVLGRFDPASHPPIRYPAAIIAGHQRADTLALMAFLQGPAASAVFAAAGFDANPSR